MNTRARLYILFPAAMTVGFFNLWVWECPKSRNGAHALNVNLGLPSCSDTAHYIWYNGDLWGMLRHFLVMLHVGHNVPLYSNGGPHCWLANSIITGAITLDGLLTPVVPYCEGLLRRTGWCLHQKGMKWIMKRIIFETHFYCWLISPWKL